MPQGEFTNCVSFNTNNLQTMSLNITLQHGKCLSHVVQNKKYLYQTKYKNLKKFTNKKYCILRENYMYCLHGCYT